MHKIGAGSASKVSGQGNMRVETFLGPLLFHIFFWGGGGFGWRGASRTGNCHMDRGGRACTDRGCSRKTQNYRRFCPPSLLSSRLKSVYSHRDPGGPGRETQNCRRFWLRLLSLHLMRGSTLFACFCLFFKIVFAWSLFRVWA